MRLLSDVASRVDDPHLRRALELALQGAGRTAPNPAVGCVIVSQDGTVAGEGFHPAAGMPHAEIFALQAAGDAARGSTVYVTLEPCDHHGKTPPCSEALVAAGVARVVVGMPDPSKLASGGAQTLRDGGIEVIFASDPTPFEELNEGWIKRVRCGLPLVTAKVGMSLDARVTVRSHARSAMTGASGTAVTRLLRAQADAVVVGASTVTIDDPALTRRDEEGVSAPHQPLRVVLVRSAPPPLTSRIFTDREAHTLVLVESHGAQDSWITQLPAWVRVGHYDGSEGLAGAFRVLAEEEGCNEVLVEPGPRLLAALWRAPETLDALVTVTAGGMGGGGGIELYGDEGDVDDHRLIHRFAAREAGIVGDVAATMWRRSDSTAV